MFGGIGCCSEADATEAGELGRKLEHEGWADVTAQYAATIECITFDELAEVMAERSADRAGSADGVLDEGHRQLIDPARRFDRVRDRSDEIADLIAEPFPEPAHELVRIGGKAAQLIPDATKRASIFISGRSSFRSYGAQR